jgi:hypothetical protein
MNITDTRAKVYVLVNSHGDSCGYYTNIADEMAEMKLAEQDADDDAYYFIVCYDKGERKIV